MSVKYSFGNTSWAKPQRIKYIKRITPPSATPLALTSTAPTTQISPSVQQKHIESILDSKQKSIVKLASGSAIPLATVVQSAVPLLPASQQPPQLQQLQQLQSSSARPLPSTAAPRFSPRFPNQPFTASSTTVKKQAVTFQPKHHIVTYEPEESTNDSPQMMPVEFVHKHPATAINNGDGGLGMHPSLHSHLPLASQISATKKVTNQDRQNHAIKCLQATLKNRRRAAQW